MTPLEEDVEAVIAEFDAWFQKRGNNEPIVKPEKAIMKTLFWWLANTRGATRLSGVLLPVKEKVEGDAQDSGGDPVRPVHAGGDGFRTPTAPSGGPGVSFPSR